MIAFIVYLYFQNYFHTYDNRLFVAGIPLLLGILPNIILHLQYLIEDSGKVILIDEENLIYKKKTVTKVIPINSIIKIEKITRENSRDGFVFKMPWAPFYFYKISLSNNEYILITCLITRNLNISNILISKKYCLIPILSSHKDIEIIPSKIE